MILSLFSDGLLSSEQDKQRKQSQRPYAYHSMLYNNMFVLAGNLILYGYQSAVNGDNSL